jgi:hypothetical protein
LIDDTSLIVTGDQAYADYPLLTLRSIKYERFYNIMSNTGLAPYNPYDNQFANTGLNDDLPPVAQELVKTEPQNAIEFLSQDNLESKARLQFIIKVYLILLGKLVLMQPVWR